MDTRKDDVIGLLQEIEKQHEEQTEALKKQLFLTRIAALAGCVLTAGILVALLLLSLIHIFYRRMFRSEIQCGKSPCRLRGALCGKKCKASLFHH